MQARKPTRDERNLLQKFSLDPHLWYVQKSSPTFLQVVNKDTKEVKILDR